MRFAGVLAALFFLGCATDPVPVKCITSDNCPQGTVCASSGFCAAAPACTGSEQLCGAACADLALDPLNCGACGHACAVPSRGAASCAGQVCGIKCLAPLVEQAGDCFLAAPGGLRATGGALKVSLAWDAVSAATGYQVLRGPAAGPYVQVGSATGTLYEDAGLTAGTSYGYQLRSVGPGGAGPATAAVTALTLPAAPAGLTATGGPAAITLSWTATPGATGYLVQRSATSGGAATQAGSPAAAAFTDQPLGDGATFFYKVQAVNQTGAGPASAEASATTQAAPQTPVITAPQYASAGDTGLSASVPANAGMTYQWTLSGGSLTSAAAGTTAGGKNAVTFTAGAAGTVTLGCSELNGAGHSSTAGQATVPVAALPVTPVITAPSTATTGQAGLQASVPARAGMTYAWTISGGALTGAPSGVTSGGINTITFTAGAAAGPLTLGCTETSFAKVSGTAATASVTVQASVVSFVHTSSADFAAGTWSGLGTSVTALNGGAVQLAPGGAELLPGGPATPLPAQQGNSAGVVWNGRFYIAGGFTSGSPSAIVRSAAFQADGTLSAWRDERAMPVVMRDQGMAAWAGRVYLAGGYASGASNAVYSAAVASDGTLGPWSTEPGLPTARNGVALVAWGARLYSVSGSANANSIDGVTYSAPIAADGTLGAWRAEVTLPGGTAWHAAAWAGRIYSLGGASQGGDTALIYSSAPGADGVLSAWRAETSFPEARNDAGIAVWNGRLYAAGGRLTTPLTGTVISSAIAADGTLSPWRVEAVSAPIDASSGFFQAGAWNGTLALVSGDAAGRSYTYPLEVTGSVAGPWATSATTLPAPLISQDTFVWRGRLHVAGGHSGPAGGGSDTSAILSAPLAADGSVGAFSTAAGSWLSSGAGQREPAALVNGHLYAMNSASSSPGGFGFGYATLGASGGAATGWSSALWPFGATSTTANWRDSFDLVSSGPYLYAVGGEDWSCGDHAEVYYTKLCADGTVCAPWTPTTSLPSGRYGGAGVAWNGRIYHLAGRTTGCPSPPIPLSGAVYSAPVNADGTLGAWTSTNALPASIEYPGLEVWDGRFYLLSGALNEPGNSPGVYSAPVNPDGSVGVWSQLADLPAGVASGAGGHLTAKWNGKLYVVGGYDYSASPAGGRTTIFSSGTTTLAPAGTYFNQFDFGAEVKLLDVAFTAAANGGGVAVFISTASSTSAFSSWTPVASSGAALGLAGVRYLRYRVELTPSAGGASPVLEDFTAHTQ